MGRYTESDRTALPRILDLLLAHCDCHVQPWCRAEIEPDDPTLCDLCPSSQRLRLSDGLTYCPFQPGSAIEIGADGKVSYARSPRDSGDYGKGFYEKRGPGRPFGDSPHWPQLPTPRRPRDPGSAAPEAPLPSAFRTARVGHGELPAIRFRVPVRNGGGVAVSSATLPCPRLVPFGAPVPRTYFTEPMSTYMQDIGDDLGQYEDMLCHERVDALGGEQTFVCHYDSTLEDLEAFIRELNRGRPGGLALDTVLVNYGMYLVLFGNDPRLQDWTEGYPDYRNMTRQGGVTFFHYGATPQEYGYAMSREQGPVFVHGPTTISCGEDEVSVERYCAVAAPPDSGVSEVPWGVRFNVVMEWKKSRAAGGGGKGA